MSNSVVDLRSDTVTQPTPGMRRAIAEAVVGDDVFGDDPTVIELERRVAEFLGKEVGLFVASGTMGNQVAIAALTRPGEEILLEADSHVYLYEAGAPAVLSGVQVRPIPGDHGLITSEILQTRLRPEDIHFPEARVLVFENTHNRAGGKVLSLEGMKQTAEVARTAGLHLHLDGARLWNAAVASGVEERRFAATCDTVTVCFSKGMGAPIGSVVCGDEETMRRARHIRKRLGGGMRQVGILAAAALYALDHHRDRLAEDHRRARHLAEGLGRIDSLRIDPESVDTNIVIIGLEQGSPDAWHQALAEEGVQVVPFGAQEIRAVTHLDVDDSGISRALEAFAAVAGRVAGG